MEIEEITEKLKRGVEIDQKPFTFSHTPKI
jgi:hypothetical protein